MPDMMTTLRNILGDGADEKINAAMNMLKNSGISNTGQGNSSDKVDMSNLAKAIDNDIKVDNNPGNLLSGTGKKTSQNSASGMNFGNLQNTLSPEGIAFLSQIKGMVDQMSNTNDSRSNLLKSLRPFMRGPRQQTIDRAIRIINIGRFSGLFGK